MRDLHQAGMEGYDTPSRSLLEHFERDLRGSPSPSCAPLNPNDSACPSSGPSEPLALGLRLSTSVYAIFCWAGTSTRVRLVCTHARTHAQPRELAGLGGSDRLPDAGKP
eukprot:2218603-Pyramimonas_sp.AAC.2